jgi:hypothetical protein
MSGTAEEIASWDRVSAAEGTNRTAWLRELANARVAEVNRLGIKPAVKPEPDYRPAWRAARHADVLAVAEEIRGAVISAGPTTNPRAITPARLESRLAKRSGHAGWTVKFIGKEFEADPPPMPKGWKP